MYKITLALILLLAMTVSLLANDPDFAKFLLNEEQIRINLAIEELKHQMTYVEEEHYSLLEKELKQLILDLEKNLIDQFKIQKLLNSQ
jgi:hypothetical protein|tara:strand:- start:761 stop:1024 length:264 start_codon:yes stop_codon:yes gene_type:complete